MRRLGLFFLTLSFLLLPGTSPAQDGQIFIDPEDPSVIRKTEVPFVSEVLISLADVHSDDFFQEGVRFGDEKFSFIALSPDKTVLAFNVDGTRHDWSGVYFLEGKKVQSLSLSFEGSAKELFWSEGGRYLAIEEEGELNKKFLKIIDFTDGKHCRLDGRQGRNKFLNFLEPWWDTKGEKIFFKVEYNNTYRKSLGLKPKKYPSRIGEAAPNCKKVVFYSVSDFMGKFPEESLIHGLIGKGSEQ